MTQGLGISVEFIKNFIEQCQEKERDIAWLENASTGDICQVIIKPLTKDANTSYLEMVVENNMQDQSHINRANVFVSHAWKYKFMDVMNALIEHDEQCEEKCYFWFDLFCNDQNNAVDHPFEWWTDRFKSSIEDIGKVLLVLTPWNNPIPLTRAWCLWEIVCSVDAADKVEFVVHISDQEIPKLKQSILDDRRAVVNCLVDVQAEKAQATNPKDKDMIFRAIEEREGGFSKVNEKVKDQMRGWMLKMCLSFVQQLDEQQQDGFRQVDVSFAADLYFNVGAILAKFWEYDQAIECYNKALEIELATLGPNDANIATTYNQLGLVYKAQGHYDKAKDLYKKGLKITIASLGNKHPEVATLCTNLGAVYNEQQKYDKATKYFERALRIQLESLEVNHPDISGSYSSLGSCKLDQGNYAKAIKYHTKALEISVSTLWRKSSRYCNNIFESWIQLQWSWRP